MVNLQTFEWISMIFIIITQKKRTVEAITFDTLNTNFSKKEKILLKAMLFYFWIVSPTLFFLADILGPYIIRVDIDVPIVSVWIVALTLSFAAIYYLMNKYHKFEFETN